MIPSGLISMSSKGISCVKIAAASALKGVEEMPWNERLQSTCFSPSSRVGGGSLKPSVSDRMGSLGAAGVGAEGLDAYDGCAAGARGAAVFAVVGVAPS